MNNLPGSADLPPGTTSKDIDGGDGGETCECCEEGKITRSPCCGEKLFVNDLGTFCILCLAEVVDLTCEACGGEGVIYPPTREEIEEAKADANED